MTQHHPQYKEQNQESVTEDWVNKWNNSIQIVTCVNLKGRCESNERGLHLLGTILPHFFLTFLLRETKYLFIPFYRDTGKQCVGRPQ